MSDKNVTYNPRVEPAEPGYTRRNFLKIGITALGALAAAELVGASILFLRARSLEGEFGGEVTAGAAADFPTNSVTEFTDGNFFLVHTAQGGYLAVYRRCPHLGCTVNWVAEEERFYCPCHASSFDMVGERENQPVPRALDTFPVSFEDGMVVVDTADFTRREHFAEEQLVYYQTSLTGDDER
jgi:cytochrome b6-f complex iron-sulfur subunit